MNETFDLRGLPQLAGMAWFSQRQGRANNALHVRYKRHPPDADDPKAFPMPDGMVRGTNRRNRAPAWYPVWLAVRADELSIWPPVPPEHDHQTRQRQLRCAPQWYTRFAVARSIGVVDSNFYRMICTEPEPLLLPQPHAVLMWGSGMLPLWPASRLHQWAAWAQRRAQRDTRAHASTPLPYTTHREPPHVHHSRT